MEAIASPVRRTRGFHHCEFCLADARPSDAVAENEDPNLVRGNGEVWFTTKDATNLAAPVMIVHYITHHEYLPPDQFIEAVRAGRRTRGLI